MVDFSRHVEETLAHLVEMAKQPGWKSKAWQAARDLAAMDPMYAQLPDRLVDAMECESTSPSEPFPASTSASSGVSELPASDASAKPRRGRSGG